MGSQTGACGDDGGGGDGCGGDGGGGDGDADGGGGNGGDDGEADGGSGGLGGESHCSSPTSVHLPSLYTQRPYPPLVARWANAAPQRSASPL